MTESQRAPRRLLAVHAHPDDETLATGGTLAHYAAEGVQTHVLTCTLGEEGEVIGERYAQLVVDAADQLGGYRIAELTRALDALGLDHPRFLLGPGHFRDSGMVGSTAAAHPRAFVRAGDEAVTAVADHIRRLRPQVVLTYDANGGYGHPDHIQAHRVTMAAVELAAKESGADPAWDVPRVYFAVVPTGPMREALTALTDMLPHWRRPDPLRLPTVDDDTVDARVDFTEQLAVKRAAMAAHATQIEVHPTAYTFALSNGFVQPILPTEYFVLGRLGNGQVAPGGVVDDLFAGLPTGD